MLKKEVDKKGLQSRISSSNLTKTEQEVYNLLTNDFLPIKKIALRRKTSRQAVHKIIKKLIKKGAINKDLKKVDNFQSSGLTSTKIRLHGQEFNIKLLYKDHRYQKQYKKSNIIFIDGNTIKLFRDSIELFINKSFLADDVDKAFYNSLKYLNRLILRVENDLKVILLKNRSQNIKLVNMHISETNNELAKDHNIRGDKFKVYAKEDGKLWGLIDNSFNLNELETVHPETSKQDMTKIRNIFNNYRDNELPLPSEIYNMIHQIVKAQETITENQVVFDKNMQSHIKAIQELANGMKRFNKQLDKLSQQSLKKWQ